MSAIGTGYDLSASQYSPDGRVFQVEYAKKAVDNNSTVIALVGRDGVVIAVEKFKISPLYTETSHSRVFNIDRHIGCVTAGFWGDGHALVFRARDEAEDFRQEHGYPIPISFLKDRLAQYVAAYTCSSAVRPFGATLILSSCDKSEGPKLYSVDPAGMGLSCYYLAVGNARQAAKAELEKLDGSKMACSELVKEAARIIHKVHNESKGAFLLELSWIGEHTNFTHQRVPENILREAEQFAKDAIAQETSSDEEMARA